MHKSNTSPRTRDMNKDQTTVFSQGHQVKHSRINYREVAIHHNGKDVETTDLMAYDVLSGVFYALTSYKDQISQLEAEGDSTDIYFVLDALLSDAQDKMEKIIDAIERHLGGRVFFLEDNHRRDDYAGIMVRKLDDDETHNRVETEQGVVP